jgi:hypothetical protein
MLWEQLVTEGHVRAAQLRNVTRRLIVVAFFLFTIAVIGMAKFPIGSFEFENPGFGLNQKISDFKTSIAEKFASAARLALSSDDLKRIPPADQLPAVLKALRESFHADGTFSDPTTLTLTPAKSADDLWSWKWPLGQILYVDDGDVRAFAAIVGPSTAAPGAAYQYYEAASGPARWLAIFRKTTKGWSDAAIQYNGFIVPEGERAVSPYEIPASLNALLAAPETSR